jgi:GNAT superfamily N-acetyltransferase
METPALAPGYRISTDTNEMDVDAVHAYLTRSYWSEGIPRDVVERSLRGSLCFGIFHGAAQIGFARVITDRATFAHLADVYVLEDHRGRGLGKQLVATILAHPDLQGLRRFQLMTRDAHELYRQFGFGPAARPTAYMEINRPDVYTSRRA